MIRRPPRSTQSRSSAASDVYKRQDETLVNMFKNGYTDMHSYTAWHIYPHIREKFPELNTHTLELVKENFPKERKISKLGNFAIQYGGTGYTCLLYTSPSPRDRTRSRMPSSA